MSTPTNNNNNSNKTYTPYHPHHRHNLNPPPQPPSPPPFTDLPPRYFGHPSPFHQTPEAPPPFGLVFSITNVLTCPSTGGGGGGGKLLPDVAETIKWLVKEAPDIPFVFLTNFSGAEGQVQGNRLCDSLYEEAGVEMGVARVVVRQREEDEGGVGLGGRIEEALEKFNVNGKKGEGPVGLVYMFSGDVVGDLRGFDRDRQQTVAGPVWKAFAIGGKGCGWARDGERVFRADEEFLSVKEAVEEALIEQGVTERWPEVASQFPPFFL